MTRNHQNDFESSDDSDESEYCAYSTIKPKWQRDYESGNFGVDYPIQLQKKVEEPKPVNVSKEFLNEILHKVRHKHTHNTQKSTESSAAQDAITAIIGTNINRENANVTQETTQTNGGGVGQMSPPENNQSANSRNIPLPFKPINYPPGFAPNPSNSYLPYPLPSFNDQMPVPPAANPYFQQPPPFGSHNSIPVRPNVGNAFGLPMIPPQGHASTNLPMNSANMNYPGHSMPPQGHFQPQPGMPHQNVLPTNVHLQNMSSQSMHPPNVSYQNVQYQNVPLPNGGMQTANVQRPSDPRLRDRPPAPPNSFVRNESPMHLPIPTRPMNSMPRPAPINRNRRRISLFDYRHREFDRIYDNDNQIPNQNGRPTNNEMNLNRNGTAHNMVHTNGHAIPSPAAAANEDNHDEDDMELSFSPTTETPASSPATEPSTDSPIPNQNGEKETNERNGENSSDIENANVAQEVEVKTEQNDPAVQRNEQNEDEDSGDSDATEEFTLETFIRDHDSKDPKEAVDNDDAATEVFGELSPQYIIQEETEASDVNAEPEERVFQMENEDNEAAFNDNEVEEDADQCADSDELLVPIPERDQAMVNQVQRCYVILEDIRETHLMDKYNARAPPQVKRKKKKLTKKRETERNRRRRIINPYSSESDSEREPEQRHPPVIDEPEKEEKVLEQAPQPVPEPEPIEEQEQASQEMESNVNPIDVGALSDIVISSDDDANYVVNNNEENNNNNNNTIVYEISSDSD